MSLFSTAQQTMQQEQETGRGEHDEPPSADVVPHQTTPHKIECSKTSYRNCGSETFLPPCGGHADNDADREEKQSHPFVARNSRRIETLTQKQHHQQRNTRD